MDDFETLLAGSKTAVERWVKARMSNPADAEDILQETYLAAFRGYRELRNPAVFLPWMLGIARRKCADFYRTKSRRNEILLDDSRKLKDRIEKSGGSAILDIEKSGWHVYQLFPIPQARSAMKRLSRYVSGLLYNKP